MCFARVVILIKECRTVTIFYSGEQSRRSCHPNRAAALNAEEQFAAVKLQGPREGHSCMRRYMPMGQQPATDVVQTNNSVQIRPVLLFVSSQENMVTPCSNEGYVVYIVV